MWRLSEFINNNYLPLMRIVRLGGAWVSATCDLPDPFCPP